MENVIFCENDFILTKFSVCIVSTDGGRFEQAGKVLYRTEIFLTMAFDHRSSCHLFYGLEGGEMRGLSPISRQLEGY